MATKSGIAPRWTSANNRITSLMQKWWTLFQRRWDVKLGRVDLKSADKKLTEEGAESLIAAVQQIVKLRIKPTRIYNMDETGLQVGMGKMPRAVL